MTRILGIESSCDETAAAVVECSSDKVLSDVVHSQIDVHAGFGGVVPELASREHTNIIDSVVTRAIETSGAGRDALDAVAVTVGPGLSGSLLIGISYANMLAACLKKPIIAVNHLQAHAYAADMPAPEGRAYPFLVLLVSGGHTLLARVDSPHGFTLLGRTIDDAAGEAFDKISKYLGLGYPGGPVVERLARRGRNSIPFPKSMTNRDNLDFSFSGLKTEVMYYARGMGRLRKNTGPVTEEESFDIAASFQETVIDILWAKTFAAAEKTGIRRLRVSGGVACNGRLRERFMLASAEHGMDCLFPPPRLCTDNAVMIAGLGGRLLEAGLACETYNLSALPNMKISECGQE